MQFFLEVVRKCIDKSYEIVLHYKYSIVILKMLVFPENYKNKRKNMAFRKTKQNKPKQLQTVYLSYLWNLLRFQSL